MKAGMTFVFKMSYRLFILIESKTHIIFIPLLQLHDIPSFQGCKEQ